MREARKATSSGGDLLASLGAINHFLDNGVVGGRGGEGVQNGSRQTCNRCKFRPKAVSDLNEIVRCTLGHPELGLNPAEEMTVARAVICPSLTDGRMTLAEAPPRKPHWSRDQ